MALEFGEELRLEMNADGQLSRSDIERHMPELAYVPKGADAAAPPPAVAAVGRRRMPT